MTDTDTKPADGDAGKARVGTVRVGEPLRRYVPVVPEGDEKKSDVQN